MNIVSMVVFASVILFVLSVIIAMVEDRLISKVIEVKPYNIVGNNSNSINNSNHRLLYMTDIR